MQLSTIKRLVPEATIYQYTSTEANHCHYATIGEQTSVILENRSTGMCLIESDHAGLIGLISKIQNHHE